MALNLKLDLKTTRKTALASYVKKKAAELATDVTNRKNGIVGKTGKTYKYAGYDRLREFFDGDQWDFAPEEGGNMRVYNFCFTTVINYTAFLTNEAPEFDVPPEDITDPIEVDRAERKEIILKEILQDNNFAGQFEDAVEGGSITGDSFIVGPFWDSDKKRVYFSYVKKPENIRPIFSSDDYQTIIGYIRDYYIAKEVADELFGDRLAERGIKLAEVPIGTSTNTSSVDNTSQTMAHIQEYWNDTEMSIYVDDHELDYVEHKWGFVPIIFVRNLPHPTRWNGVSDIENVLDPQVEYNEKNSAISDINNDDAYPVIFGKNLMPTNIQSGKMQLIDLGEDAELLQDPRRANQAAIETVIEKRRRDIMDQSGLNEILYSGGSQEATGRALSVLMQGVNNRVKGRQRRWNQSLQILCRNIFRLLEIYVPKSKELINNYYKVDIFFPSTLLRNVTDEINKYSRKLQSRYTTMKNLGTPSPKDEEHIMEEEAITDAEIQFKAQQILTGVTQQVMNKQSAGPQLNEGENQPGENPVAVAGVKEQSPTSPAGAIAQQNQRATGMPDVTD